MKFDILECSDFDEENIRFSDPIALESCEKVDILYNYENHSDKLRISVPWINIITCDESTCAFSLKKMTVNPKMTEVYDFFRKFDGVAISIAKQNIGWFDNSSRIKYKKSMLKSNSLEELEDDSKAGWTYPIIKCSTNSTEVYGKKMAQMSLSDLCRGQIVKAILECDGLWIKNFRFGSSWRVVQILAGEKEIGEIEYSFMESDDEDEGDRNDYNYDSELITDVDF